MSSPKVSVPPQRRSLTVVTAGPLLLLDQQNGCCDRSLELAPQTPPQWQLHDVKRVDEVVGGAVGNVVVVERPFGLCVCGS